jgi:8-oxo-dGTP diphosphatase
LQIASAYDAKIFINSDLSLAKEINVAGVHFTSAQLIRLTAKPEGVLCGAACHNVAELQKAAQLELDYVTLSPVSPTLSHPDAETLGWAKFSAMLTDYPIPVYALGGMQMHDLEIAKQHGAHGIALQRGVWGD